MKLFFQKWILKKKKRAWLLPFSFLFGLILKMRHFLYDKRLLHVAKARVPVISIGNIAVGGSGKTPFACFLSKALEEKKCKVAILSRGYLSKSENKAEVRRVFKGDAFEDVGDEPLLMAEKGFSVFISKKRSLSAKKAEEEGFDLLILDDGLQHRALLRDKEIILIHKDDLTAALLPRGRLRDLPERLKKADLLVLNHFDGVIPKGLEEAPLIGIRYVPICPKKIERKKIAAFCALARPDLFLKTVRSLDCELVDFLEGIDHENFSLDCLNSFFKKSGADFLVCSEKDWVKCRDYSLPILPLPIEVEIVYGKEQWDAFLGDCTHP